MAIMPYFLASDKRMVILLGQRYYFKHKRKFDLISGLFLSNTVLGSGLVVAPVVIASNTLKNGVVLGIAFFIITFFTVLLSRLIPKKVPYTVRVVVYVLLAAVIYIPTSMLLTNILPDTVYKVGIFLPLLITNSLITQKIEGRFKYKRFGVMMVDLISHILGFVIVIILVGAIREILGTGMIWDTKITLISIKTAPAIMYPFCGFIILGFLSAVLQKIKLTVQKPQEDGKDKEGK